MDLAAVFGPPPQRDEPPAASRHRLRCAVCYFGHHYLVFALVEEEGAAPMWVEIDDDEAQVVGCSWADVCRAMVARRLQPSLLFYEEGA